MHMTRKRDIRQIDTIVRKHGLSREQRKLLHRVISGSRLDLREIERIAREIKQDDPKT